MATDRSAAPPPPLYSSIEEWPETPAGPGKRRSIPDSTQRLRRRNRQGRWPSLERERALWAAGYRRIAGADEVGTGSIAGPVVAAAVVLPLADDFGADIAARLWEVRDSKCITTERKRQRLAALVRAVCQAAVGVGVVSVEEWEALRGDLVQASRLAVRRALGALPQLPDYVLLDGGWQVPGVAVPYAPIRAGDGCCLSIAAASLVAKVARDELMHALDAQHPGYGFGQHKGYPTPAHFAAKMRLGPIPGVHREVMSWPPSSWAGTPPGRQS